MILHLYHNQLYVNNHPLGKRIKTYSLVHVINRTIAYLLIQTITMVRLLVISHVRCPLTSDTSPTATR